MNTVVVGVGSNIHPQKNTVKAKALLGRQHKLLAESTFQKTKPIGWAEQPDFLNGAILLETEQTLEQFKNSLKNIELSLGREQTSHPDGPRTIDLDILVWNGEIINQDFYERKFVQEAVLEIFPDLKF